MMSISRAAAQELNKGRQTAQRRSSLMIDDPNSYMPLDDIHSLPRDWSHLSNELLFHLVGPNFQNPGGRSRRVPPPHMRSLPLSH
jgi:hypothetical protein